MRGGTTVVALYSVMTAGPEYFFPMVRELRSRIAVLSRLPSNPTDWNSGGGCATRADSARLDLGGTLGELLTDALDSAAPVRGSDGCIASFACGDFTIARSRRVTSST